MPEIKQERKRAFWDIESLSNVFMFAIYFPNAEIKNDIAGNPKERDWLMFFYLLDDMTMTKSMQIAIESAVFRDNPDLDKSRTDIQFMDLKEEATNRVLVDLFTVDDKSAFAKPEDNQFLFAGVRPRDDLSSDPKWPYMIGYNSTNYDCTMMAYYFNETWGFSGKKASFMPTTAAFMRKFNNELFAAFIDSMPKALKFREKDIYENMLRTGLFLDAGKINDKVYKMPLKRIEGQMGMDIFEDEDVKDDKPIKGAAELCKLFAYNASDCVKLKRVFEHRAYFAKFQLKKGLLDEYPDLIYDAEGKVRINRLKIDDTSAKFAARVLCPDGFLPDIHAVSYEYPKGSGRNILKETREWAAEKFKEAPEALAQLNAVFDYYGAIEGKNFDASDHYISVWGADSLPVSNVRDIPVPKTCVPYFDRNGKPTSTYVNFSIGGIHGAEYNKALYDQHVSEYAAQYKKVQDFVSRFTEDELKALKPTIELDGEKIKVSAYITKRKDGSVSIKWPKPVELFKQNKNGNWELNKKYAYCSDDEVDHEDFTSYYPGLLMQMQAFLNEALGEDRYVKIFGNKTLYGKYMKDPARPTHEQDFYATLREGTKLILNSASGAADAMFDNNIRMNNVIISMRVIGQMFTWRIGQAQTLEGFKITSTNTDGLYAACDKDTRAKCREILEREAKTIGVPIEPEEMRLISKDANNRVEIGLDGKILSASGGDAACWKGPVPTKALSHPALIDAMLVQYLKRYGVNEPFDIGRAMDVLSDLKATKTPLEMLLLYQQIINSSESSCRYIFAEVDGQVRTLQHNNRIFAIKTDAAHLMMANAMNAAGSDTKHDPVADQVLKAHGVDLSKYNTTRVIKISRIDPEQNMFIYNKALDQLPEATMNSFLENLDDGYYVNMLSNAYANWCNLADHEAAPDEEEAA